MNIDSIIYLCVCMWERENIYLHLLFVWYEYNLYSVVSPVVAMVKGQLFLLLQDMQLSQEGLQSVFIPAQPVNCQPSSKNPLLRVCIMSDISYHCMCIHCSTWIVVWGLWVWLLVGIVGQDVYWRG